MHTKQTIHAGHFSYINNIKRKLFIENMCNNYEYQKHCIKPIIQGNILNLSYHLPIFD